VNESAEHTFLLGYNVESSDSTRPGVIEPFLRAASKLHREMAMRCTLFVRGRTIEEHADAFRRLRDDCGGLVDLQQFTYSGLPLKTVCRRNHEGAKLFRGGTLEQCRDDVARASDVMADILGIRPLGLAGPLGYYRGLSDRPDILEMLKDLGIRFTRTYTRNARDWSPLSFETQPFRYEAQGFGDMLEIPGQGWPDCLLWEAIDPEKPERYIRHIKKDLDYVAAKGLTWSFIQYDWSAVRYDPEMNAMRAVLEYVRRTGFRVLSHRAYYEECAASLTTTAVGTPDHSNSAPPVLRDEQPGNSDTCRKWKRHRIILFRRCVARKGRAQLRKLLRKAGSRHRHRLLLANKGMVLLPGLTRKRRSV